MSVTEKTVGRVNQTASPSAPLCEKTAKRARALPSARVMSTPRLKRVSFFRLLARPEPSGATAAEHRSR